jgi:hypothetical protein
MPKEGSGYNDEVVASACQTTSFLAPVNAYLTADSLVRMFTLSRRLATYPAHLQPGYA